MKHILVFFLTLTACPLHAMPVKFINETDYYVRAMLDNEIGVFGVGPIPVIHSNVSPDETIKIEMEIVRKPSKIDETLALSIVDATTTGLRAARNINESAREVARLQGVTDFFLDLSSPHIPYTRPIILCDTFAINEALVVTEGIDPDISAGFLNSLDAGKTARNAVKLGVANIGLLGLDWYLGSNGTKKFSIEIQPDTLHNYDNDIDQELVFKVSEGKIHFFIRQIADDEPKGIKCKISNNSEKNIVCRYHDTQGDEVYFRLDPKRFKTGEMKVSRSNPEIVVYEASNYSTSNVHHSLSLSKGALSLGTAAIDPFPFTKVLSLVTGVHDVCSGIYGVSKNFMEGRLKFECSASEWTTIEVNKKNKVKFKRKKRSK